MPDNATLDISRSSITLATWVRPEKTGDPVPDQEGYRRVARTGTSSRWRRAGSPFVRFNSTASGHYLQGGLTEVAYPNNGTTWMHLAATSDGTTIRLYVNGTEVATKPAPAAITTSNLALGIGAQGDGTSPLQGAMDDVLLYNTALSATEIAALAATPPGNAAPVADFDGDGDTDLSVFRPSEGGWYMQSQPPFPQIWGTLGGSRCRVTMTATAQPTSRCSETASGMSRVSRCRSGARPVTSPFRVTTTGTARRTSRCSETACGMSRVRRCRSGVRRVTCLCRVTMTATAATDLAVFRNGEWYVKGQALQIWGQAGDVPVPGDYDGNGTTDLAVFRNGEWYVKGQALQIWGQAGDVPVPGDYDGNGTTDIAVFRNGVWYVKGQPLQIGHNLRHPPTPPIRPAHPNPTRRMRRRVIERRPHAADEHGAKINRRRGMLTSRVWRVVLVTGLAGALLAVMVSGAAMAASPAIGDWRMNEGSGTTLVDSSVSANNGTILGNPTWVTGQHGQAIRFDGTGDYATVPDNATLDISSSITLATWVRPEKTGTQYLIKKATQGGTDGYELSLATTGFPFVRFNSTASGTTYRVDSPIAYPNNGTTWMHLAATSDGTTIRLYVNGTEVATKPAPAAITTNNLALGIGAQGDGTSPLQGAMDDVLLYNTALSATEIAALAGAVPGNTPPSLNPVGNKGAQVGTQLAFTASATDPDAGDTLTFSLAPGSGGSGPPVPRSPAAGTSRGRRQPARSERPPSTFASATAPPRTARPSLSPSPPQDPISCSSAQGHRRLRPNAGHRHRSARFRDPRQRVHDRRQRRTRPEPPPSSRIATTRPGVRSRRARGRPPATTISATARRLARRRISITSTGSATRPVRPETVRSATTATTSARAPTPGMWWCSTPSASQAPGGGCRGAARPARPRIVAQERSRVRADQQHHRDVAQAAMVFLGKPAAHAAVVAGPLRRRGRHPARRPLAQLRAFCSDGRERRRGPGLRRPRVRRGDRWRCAVGLRHDPRRRARCATRARTA